MNNILKLQIGIISIHDALKLLKFDIIKFWWENIAVSDTLKSSN